VKKEIDKKVNERIFQVWKQLLHAENIHIDEDQDFFSLGGTSLLATQLLTKVREEFYIECTLREFLENPTISFLLKLSEHHPNANTYLKYPVIPKTQDNNQQLFSLSFSQQRLWFIDQLYPESELYNDAIMFQLTGKIDPEMLEKAFHALIERHSILKAKFVSTENSTVWQYFDVLPLPNLVVINLSNLTEKQKEKESTQFINKETKRNFNLSQDFLIRFFLIILDSNKHILLITMHHIISDGWSMELLTQELSILYNSFCLNQKPKLEEIPFHYVDFAIWQKEWFQGAILEQQLSYWKKKLEEIPDTINIPTDHPRPRELTYRGASYRTIIKKKICENIRRVSDQQKVTLFMTLLASFQAFLFRYSGQEDIVIGTPIANRHYPQVEKLIGFFVNTLVLRAHCKKSMTFLELLLQVKETTLEAYDHQDIPFEQLVDYLKISRNLNRNPVFQIMFVFEREKEKPKLSLENVEAHLTPVNRNNAIFDLTFHLQEMQEGISLNINYSLDLFEKDRIRQMSEHFKIFLESILKNPNQPLYEFSILTKKEQQQLLIGCNDTKTEYIGDKTIHQLFEEQAERTSYKIAAIYEDKKLTYQELNQKANQLAHYLRSQGVGPETLVALAVERSLETIIGIIGILKSGGTYVPLDVSSNPQERLMSMLEDIKPTILLTQTSLKKLFDCYHGIILTFDRNDRDFQRESKNNLPHLTTSHQLAYIIHTSGSTGKPKGIMIRHCSLHNLLESFHRAFQNDDQKACSLWTNISFDVSTYEIFSTLLNGGELHILNDNVRIDSEALLKYFEMKNIERAYCPPSIVKDLLAFSKSNNKLSLKNLLVGVEPIPHIMLMEILENIPNLKIINAYGPTENTVCSTLYLLDNKYTHSNKDKTPIGRPISNTKAYILDDCLNPVPIGVKGELYLGGIGLARGYLNQPDLTAEKFIPNPFINNNETPCDDDLRLYRTGDLARHLSDGNIEFLERFDDQIKIRGFRVELKEIESTIRTHKDAEEAVVVTYEKEEGENKTLVAYIVPQLKWRIAFPVKSTIVSSSQVSFSILTGESLVSFTEDLRNRLVQFLPDYMIPSFFIYLDKIPMTSNGKIDRKSLPAPNLSVTNIQEQYVAPSNSIQQELTSIWSEVLKIKQISVHDNFFRIGGDSIISIQLVAKARQRKLYFKAKDVFNYPTIATLSCVIKTQEDEVSIKPDQNSVEGIVSLGPIQQWFFQQNFSHKNHYNQSFLLKCQSRLSISALTQALTLLVSHHDAFRFKYYQDKPREWKQEGSGLIYNPYNLLTIVDLSKTNDSILEKRIEQKSNRAHLSLDIEKGPLIKAFLFDCGQNRPTRLLIVIHHLVIDSVSWRIVLGDIERFYFQIIHKTSFSLPEKTHSYQQWVKALNEYATSNQLTKEIAYWKKIESLIKALPIDFNKGPSMTAACSTVILSLTKQETFDLLQKIPKAYKTEINDILLTALVLSIGDWTQEYTLSLILEGHGREEIIKDIDLSRTVGWFTSIFPVHLNISKPNDLGEAIKTTKEALRTIPYKGIGYGILRFLRQDVDFGITDNPTISFNYQGQWDNSFSHDKLFNFSQESSGNNVSKYNKRPYLIEINAEVIENKLLLHWAYSTNHYLPQTIESISSYFMHRLKQLIHHCSQDKTFGYTSSDFKLAKLTEKTLANKMNILSKIRN
jgi:amino acid adenylation domain-containing protein/non-ribosomal peptide synthase protein (TIGR01720 family)